MEILRARLIENNYHGNTFLDMSKARGGHRDGFPCKAKRKLFADSPAGVENLQAEANLRRDGNSPYERLEDRYTDFQVFKDPPTPYRTVCHRSGAWNSVGSTQKVKGDENVAESSPSTRSRTSESSSTSASTTQSRLQDYYKPKKRARVSSPQHKTPEPPIRTRTGSRRTVTSSQKT